MKVELGKKKKKQEAEVGDIIEFEEDTIGLVIQKSANNEKQKIIVLGNMRENYFWLSESSYQDDFKQGKYKILARADEWKIVRDD